jgi:hypothetical protein
MKRLVVVLAVVSCGKKSAREAPPPPEASIAAAPKPAPTVDAKAPMRVMRMATRGFLRITEGGKDREEPLPDSPLKSGEFPEACWVAPDGAVYAVGKQYTGVPGPDYGAVWRRAPDGTWTTAFRLKDRTFHSIAGVSANEIVVGTLGGYVGFDGKAWTVHDLPDSMINVWTDGKKLYGQDFDDTKTYAIARGDAKAIAHAKHDAHDDRYKCARGTARYRVFDKSTEVGEEDLSPEEEAEIRGEMKDIQDHPERIRPAE